MNVINRNLLFSTYAIILIVMVISCNGERKTETKDQGYVVEGTIKNMPDSTWIFLGYNQKTDSIKIINEKFTFSGMVEEPESKYISFKDYDEGFIHLWIEDTIINIFAERGNLKKATIKGGVTERENQVRSALKYTIRKKSDSIQKLYRTGKVTDENRKLIGKLNNDVRKQSLDVDKQFIRNYPDSYVSVAMLHLYNTTFEKEEVHRLYDQLSNRMKNSKKGVEIKKFLDLPNTPDIGDTFIDFELPDTDGKKVKLSDFKGKITLIEFWASWCTPCRKANPKLITLYEKYKDDGFKILGVSLDNNEKHWKNAVVKDNLPWTNVSSLEGDKTEVSLIYGVNGIPDNFIIDEDGKIIAKTLRGKKLEKKLEEIFSKSPTLANYNSKTNIIK